MRSTLGIELRKWVAKTGLVYLCKYCGEKLYCDEDKFNWDYQGYSYCPKCTNLERFDI